MRSWIAILVVGLPLAAAADDPKKPKPIDVSASAANLDVYADDVGNFYVSPRPGTVPFDDAGKLVFYGDGKTMYQQRVIGSSADGTHYEWSLWSPRAKGMQAALIDLSAGVMHVDCRPAGSKRPLQQLTADKAKTLLQHATFYPPLWQRQSHLLARDDDANYYFIDELREEYGGNGFRVFVGPKGAMKEVPLANVATDTAGEIFATKTGQLKLISSGDKKAFWSKGGKKVELTMVDLWENRYLIYRELGIYGQLGAVCDDQ